MLVLIVTFLRVRTYRRVPDNTCFYPERPILVSVPGFIPARSLAALKRHLNGAALKPGSGARLPACAEDAGPRGAAAASLGLCVRSRVRCCPPAARPREELLPELRSAGFPLTLNSAAAGKGARDAGRACRPPRCFPCRDRTAGCHRASRRRRPARGRPRERCAREAGAGPPRPCLPQPRSKPGPRAGANRRSSVSIHLPVLKLQRGSGRRNPPWLGPARRPPPAAARVRARSGAQRSCRPGPSASALPPGSAGSLPRLHARRPSCPLVVSLLSFFYFYFFKFFLFYFFSPTGNAQSGLMDISELCISDPLGYHNQ